MKRLSAYILSIVLTTAYLLGTTGFGIHICSYDHTHEVLIVNTLKECEEIHLECQCPSASCDSHSHDEECCKTELFILDIDKENFDNSYETYPKLTYFAYTPLSQSSSELSSNVSKLLIAHTKDGPIPGTGQFLSLISVWIL